MHTFLTWANKKMKQKQKKVGEEDEKGWGNKKDEADKTGQREKEIFQGL